MSQPARRERRASWHIVCMLPSILWSTAVNLTIVDQNRRALLVAVCEERGILLARGKNSSFQRTRWHTMSQSLLDNWSDEGCAAAISEAAASPADPSAPNPLKVVLHDLSSAVVRGALEPERLVTVLSDAALVDRALLPRVQSDLADIFWFLGLRIEAEKSDEDGDGAPKQQLLAL
ncbi:hypothetical protein EMIHUDRAFT_254148, partial [Emiliania huxleyi CCMP1516]|uniref:Uncharacterized protein n=2 Tax=Emiliania huxleyi TaxID=2903 RepID=A0A0D3JGI1_EMIH1